MSEVPLCILTFFDLGRILSNPHKSPNPGRDFGQTRVLDTDLLKGPRGSAIYSEKGTPVGLRPHTCLWLKTSLRVSE
jgi:hypothetical protein